MPDLRAAPNNTSPEQGTDYDISITLYRSRVPAPVPKI